MSTPNNGNISRSSVRRNSNANLFASMDMKDNIVED